MRLRLEKRKAEREGNFESAALVLGLAERNQASKDEKYVIVLSKSCLNSNYYHLRYYKFHGLL